MLLENLEADLEATLEGASVTVERTRGDDDHLAVTVVWDGFEGQSLLEQHSTVKEAIDPALNERIHALEITTEIPKP